MTGLRATALASVRWTAGAMIVRAALTLIQLIILARLLTPEAFGVLAIALALQNVALGLSDMGLSSAVIHMPALSETQKSSLFWVTGASGLAISLALLLTAPIIAGFFGAQHLAPVLALGCWAILASALGSQFRALGEKHLQFGILARIEVVSAGLGFILTIAMALSGFGVLSVPAGALLAAACNSVLCWHWLAGGWRPHGELSLSAIRAHLGYGVRFVLTGLANLAGQQADVLVAGRLVSTSALGHYFPAREFGMRATFLLNPIVTRVGFPLIAQNRLDHDRVARIYSQTVLMTASVSFPLYGALAIFAPEVVRLALGDAWVPTIPLLQAVAVWCALRAIGNPIGGLLFGAGETTRALVSSVTITILVFVTAVFGAHWGGMAGVPWALALLYLALIVPMWFWLVRPACGLSFRDYHVQLIKPVACTGVAVCAAWLATTMFTGDLTRLSIGLASGGAAYLLASAAFNRQWLGAMGALFMLRPIGHAT